MLKWKTLERGKKVFSSIFIYKKNKKKNKKRWYENVWIGALRVAYEKQKQFLSEENLYPVIRVACFWKSLQERSMAKKYLLKDESRERIPEKEEECSRVRRNSFMFASNQDVWSFRMGLNPPPPSPSFFFTTSWRRIASCALIFYRNFRSPSLSKLIIL